MSLSRIEYSKQAPFVFILTSFGTSKLDEVPKHACFLVYEYCSEGEDWSNLSDEQFDFVTASSINLCEDDDEKCAFFDMSTCQFHNKDQLVVRGTDSGRSLTFSDSPRARWKQLTDGLQFWANNYINNCYGMRFGRKAYWRAHRLYERTKNRIPVIYNSVQNLLPSSDV